MPLSLEQLHALQRVEHSAAFALAAQVGLDEEPDNARQRDIARDARNRAVSSAIVALDLGISSEQVNRVVSDAFQELIANWSSKHIMRGAAERAARIVHEGFKVSAHRDMPVFRELDGTPRW